MVFLVSGGMSEGARPYLIQKFQSTQLMENASNPLYDLIFSNLILVYFFFDMRIDLIWTMELIIQEPDVQF